MRTGPEAVSEIKRELGVRRRCYARWIADGKLTEVEAVDRMERLEAALAICERSVSLAAVPAAGTMAGLRADEAGLARELLRAQS